MQQLIIRSKKVDDRLNSYKTKTILLVVLLTTIGMVPLVNAASRPTPILDWSKVEPTRPIQDSDLVTFILSEKTFNQLNTKSGSPYFEINILNFNLIELNNSEINLPNCYLYNSDDLTGPISVMRIPKTMFDYFKQGSKDNSISVPIGLFHPFSNVKDFNNQRISSPNKSQITSSIYTDSQPTELTSIEHLVASEGHSYQKRDIFSSDGSGHEVTYIIGFINLDHTYQHVDSVYIFAEREFALDRYDIDNDGIDTIEIVASYDTHLPPGSPNGVNLYPVIYNGDINQSPIYPGYIHVSDLNSRYWTYMGVGIGPNVGLYEIWLQNYDTDEWLAYWNYYDTVIPSHYIRSPRISSEFYNLPGASGTFDQEALIHDIYNWENGVFSNPIQNYQWERSTQNLPIIQYVNTAYTFLSPPLGYLYTKAYCQGTI